MQAKKPRKKQKTSPLPRGAAAALSRRSGVSEAYLSLLLSGRARAGAGTAIRLAAAAEALDLGPDPRSILWWLALGRTRAALPEGRE